MMHARVKFRLRPLIIRNGHIICTYYDHLYGVTLAKWLLLLIATDSFQPKLMHIDHDAHAKAYTHGRGGGQFMTRWH